MPMARLAGGVLLAATLLASCAAPSPPREAKGEGVRTPAPPGTVVPAGTMTPGPPSAEAGPTPTSPPAAEVAPALPPGPSIGALPPLTADTAMDQVVERAPLPPEARALARTLRPTMTAEHDGAGHWVVSAGTLGQWRVHETTWVVEPADGVAELWEIQSRLDLR